MLKNDTLKNGTSRIGLCVSASLPPGFKAKGAVINNGTNRDGGDF